jgi:hypothetical protein
MHLLHLATRRRLLEAREVSRIERLEAVDQLLERGEAAPDHHDVRQQRQHDRESEQAKLHALLLNAQVEIRRGGGSEQHRRDEKDVDQNGLAYEGAALAHRKDGV